MEDIVFTKEEDTKLLKGLNPSKALRPDEPHPRVLNELATEYSPIFVHLFQQSIDSGGILRNGHLQTLSFRFLDLSTLQVTGTQSMLKRDEHKLLSGIQEVINGWAKVLPSKQRIWDLYGPQMGNYMGLIWATHMGPMWVLQQGFICDPSGHIHMGPIRASYRIFHINRPSHIMHIE